MGRAKRWAGFRLDPDEVLRNPAFVLMSRAAQRAYLILTLKAWQEHYPGVIPGVPGYLAGLCGLQEYEWHEIEREVQRGFRIRRKDGAWTIPWMCEAHQVQNIIHKRLSAAGRLGAEVTNSKRTPPEKPTLYPIRGTTS